jgi:hypothetical protein
MRHSYMGANGVADPGSYVQVLEEQVIKLIF